MAGRRGFGSVRQLPSGRWQARYRGPDGVMRPAQSTYPTKTAAQTFLATVQADIIRRTWRAPEAADVLLRDYADGWLAARTLRPRTRAHYRRLLDAYILPALGGVPLAAITPVLVREWHHGVGEQTGPTMRAHAYGLLRTILGTAVAEDAIAANPCRVRGAGSVKRAAEITPATVAEIAAIAAAMPPRYRALVLVSAWCGLRFGEATELRRSDVDLDAGRLRIARAVVRTGGRFVVGEPKTDAGRRTVAIPPHLLPVLTEHLGEHAEDGPHALVFPAASGGHLAPATLYRVYYPARDKAGRPDLRWHDLRHTAAVLAAASGATLADLMHRLGHTTPAAAMRYQHMAEDRDAALAAALSEAASGVVLPLRPRQRGA
jgi:integrase